MNLHQMTSIALVVKHYYVILLYIIMLSCYFLHAFFRYIDIRV